MVRARFVGKIALEHEQLSTLIVRNHAEFCSRTPMLEDYVVEEARLLVEILLPHPGYRARLPRQPVCIQHDVAPRAAGKLSQFDEQNAAILRKGTMAKTFRVQKKRADRPISVLI